MGKSAHEIAHMTQLGLNLISQAISIYDKNLKLAVSNKRFQDMFNLPGDLVKQGASFAQTIHYLASAGDYGDIDDIDTFVKERLDQARTFEVHYLERMRPNGMYISVEGSPLRSGGWVTVYTDITNTKKQEEMLRGRSIDLSEQLLSRSEELAQINRKLTASITALEQAKNELVASEAKLNLTNLMTPAHIARLGTDGRYTYSNQKLDTIIPNRPKDINGMHFKDALGPDAYAAVLPYFKKTMGGQASAFEFSLRDLGKQIRVAFTPETDDTGAVIGAYLLSMDITEETTARRALVHAHRRELAAQLTSGLAHDFSNLLTIILGQQNKLETLPDLTPEQLDIVSTTKAAALRGGVLLDGLSQIDTTRSLSPSPVNIAELADNVERLAKAAVSDKIEIVFNNALGSQNLILDQGFAQDALLNLILNANEAIQGPGIITIDFNRVNNWLEMSVTDTGSGFSDDALKNAFTPFYTTKSGSVGRGLGLVTVFDFAKLSNGRVGLKNTLESGACLTIRIPYVNAPAHKPGLVLLVEDSIDIRQTIRDYLRRMGHSVIETDSAEEAMTLTNIPNLTHIVTDLMLAGKMTGFDLATQLCNNNIAIPIVIITALPANNPLRSMASKNFPILHKPFTQQELEALFYESTVK